MPFMSRDYLDYYLRQHNTVPGLIVGKHPDTGDDFVIYDKDRYGGTYIIGVAGTGKSSGIEEMIYQDIDLGRAVIVIDPHGDLTNNCIAELPAHAVERTFVLDMKDVGYPYGVNVFGGQTEDNELDTTRRVESIKSIFTTLWPEIEGQANLP